MKLDFDECIKSGVEQAMKECELTIGMTLKEAVEKQIPKKPTPQVVKGGKKLIGNGWWCKGTTVYRCPNCNELITRTYDYCYKCGQALDWGDRE